MPSPQATHPDLHRRTGKVRQACDTCRSRKIRCDGAHPCVNCLDINCECTYLAVPKKTGPKGRRKTRSVDTKTVSYFSTALPSAVRASTGYMAVGTTSYHARHVRISPKGIPSPPLEAVDSSSSILSRGSFSPSPRVTKEIITSCLDAFFRHKYAITPVLDRNVVYDAIHHLQNRPEMYGLITACCAVMVLYPDVNTTKKQDEAPFARPSEAWHDPNYRTDGLPPDVPTAEFFISETARARNFCDCVERPTLTTIQTSWLLFAAFFSLGKDTSAWHYIREAITILQSLRYHEESTYQALKDPVQAHYIRRMFWVLFVTERAYALQRHRPLTLQSAIALPSADQELGEKEIMSGLLDLISLFRNFDSDFLSMWNTNDSHVPASTKSYPAKLQQVLEKSIPQVAQRTANQQADLLLSREWLKIVVWQLCVSKTLLCSSSPLECMSLKFPVSIARNVVLTTSLLPSAAMEANGVGIVEKIFDIGCSLADVLSVNPHCVTRTSLEVSPADYLREMVRLVSTAAGGSPRHLKVLAAKTEECLRSGTLYIMSSQSPMSEYYENASAPVGEETGIGGGEERTVDGSLDSIHSGQVTASLI